MMFIFAFCKICEMNTESDFFLFWLSRWYNISGSQMGLQLLQNIEIVKQTDELLWKNWRKYGTVLYLFSCDMYYIFIHTLI